MSKWQPLELLLGDYGDAPLNERESWLNRQECEPEPRKAVSDRAASKAEQERQQALRQREKRGIPCPHGCGFYFATYRYAQALSTHERACPGITT